MNVYLLFGIVRHQHMLLACLIQIIFIRKVTFRYSNSIYKKKKKKSTHKKFNSCNIADHVKEANPNKNLPISKYLDTRKSRNPSMF